MPYAFGSCHNGLAREITVTSADLFEITFDGESLAPEEEWAAIEDLLDNIDAVDSPEITEDLWPSDAPDTPVQPDADEPLQLSDFIAFPPLVSVVAHDIVDALSSFFTIIDYSDNDVLSVSSFTDNGTYDPEHGCLVMGGVTEDIQYLDGQTGPTCSLMAQEQFVERYINHDIPEDVLEWRAETWGYYEPEGLGSGTNWMGQAAILEHFNIPHSRDFWASVDQLDASLKAGNDAIVGVDARAFYQDASMPSGAGHAVAVVGWGADPSSLETTGYYITDSNFPGTVRFLSRERLESCWFRDMISVASPGG